MNGETSCEHPVSDAEVKIVEELPDGTPVLQATCNACAQTSGPEPLVVEYVPRPVKIGGRCDRWFPLVKDRGNLAVCGLCGQVIFPELHPPPVVVFIHNNEARLLGEVDFCEECGLKVIKE